MSRGRRRERACALMRNIEDWLGSFIHPVEADDYDFMSGMNL